MSAAGVAPSRTIATTSARKLPDISNRVRLPRLALVSIAHKSETIAKPSRDTSKGRFQLAEPAAAIASPVAATSIDPKAKLAYRPGAGIVKAAPTALLSVTRARKLKPARNNTCD